MLPSTAALAFAMLVAIEPSHAAEGPWCAYESGGAGFYTSRCDLPSYEACRTWINASPGTWCTQNPRYGGPPQRSRTSRPR
jgi:hypothetical protein